LVELKSTLIDLELLNSGQQGGSESTVRD